MKTPIYGTTIIPLPTLSKQGYVYTVGERMDRMLAYYFAADKNQSDIFTSEVVSFKHSCSENIKNPFLLSQKVRDELQTYFEKVFQYVEVDVTHKFLNDDGDEVGGYEIIIDVICGDTFEDRQRVLKGATVENSVFASVISYTNDMRVMNRDRFDTSAIRAREQLR